MSDELEIEGTPEVIAAVHSMVLRQAAEARARYRLTGQYSTFNQTPTIHGLHQHLQFAIAYASQTLPRSGLPRKFTWCGTEYGVVFPERGAVLIVDRKTQEILNVGQAGWVDPSHPEPRKS